MVARGILSLFRSILVSLPLGLLAPMAPCESVRDEPDWAREEGVHKGYPAERYFVGLGRAEFRHGHEKSEARRASLDKALANMTREITVAVRTQTKERILETIRGRKDELSQQFDECIETTTAMEVKHVQPINEAVQKRLGRPDVYWTRVAVDRADTARRLLEELNQSGGEVSGRLELARADLAKGMAAPALRQLVVAKSRRLASYSTEALWRTMRPRGNVETPTPGGPGIETIDGELNSLFSSLHVESDRGDRQVLQAGGSLTDPVVARVNWVRDGKAVPAPGLPVRFDFENATGRILVGVRVRGKGFAEPMATSEQEFLVAESDANGEVGAHVEKVESREGSRLASVRAAIAVEALVREVDAPFRDQAREWLRPLGAKSALFTFEPPIPYAAWVGSLAAEVAALMNAQKATGVVLGAFWYGDVPLPGAFGQGLRATLGSELRNRGMTLEDWDAERRFPALFGEYTVDSRQIEVHWVLQAGEGATVGEGRSRICREQVPAAGLQPETEDVNRVQAHLAQVWQPRKRPKEGELAVDVWTNHGPRPVFVTGDALRVFLRATKDCHVQLIYTDATGVSFFILPNQATGREKAVQLTGGRTRLFPDPAQEEKWTYRFNDKSIGLGTLKVLVSSVRLTAPVPTDDYPHYAGGFEIRRIPLGTQLARSKGCRARGLDVEFETDALARADMAEGLCIIYQER